MPELRTLLAGLRFGESPRWHEERLWFCDWAAEQLRAKPSAARSIKTYATQKEAIVAARELVKRGTSGRIVVHGRDGSMRSTDVRGLRAIQTSPVKSSLGTKAIKKAVSTVIRERLALNSRY